MIAVSNAKAKLQVGVCFSVEQGIYPRYQLLHLGTYGTLT